MGKKKTLASATLCVQAGGKKSYLLSSGFYLPGWAGTGITERQATARGISRSTDKIRPPEEDYISDNAIKLSTQLDPECTHYTHLPHTALELAHGEFTREKGIYSNAPRGDLWIYLDRKEMWVYVDDGVQNGCKRRDGKLSDDSDMLERRRQAGKTCVTSATAVSHRQFCSLAGFWA